MPDASGENRWYFPKLTPAEKGRTRKAVTTLHVRYSSAGGSYCDPANVGKLTSSYVLQSTVAHAAGLRLCGSCLRSINGKQ
jgi:hypothetical protein